MTPYCFSWSMYGSAQEAAEALGIISSGTAPNRSMAHRSRATVRLMNFFVFVIICFPFSKSSRICKLARTFFKGIGPTPFQKML